MHYTEFHAMQRVQVAVCIDACQKQADRLYGDQRPRNASNSCYSKKERIQSGFEYELDSELLGLLDSVPEIYCLNQIECMYRDLIHEPVLQTLRGVHSCVLLYGQRKTGKLRMLQGTVDQAGLMDLAIRDIFQYLEFHMKENFLVRCTYCEIIEETVYDLLSHGRAIPVQFQKIRKDASRVQDICVKNLLEEIIISPRHFSSIICFGNRFLRGWRLTNAQSHSICRITIERQIRRNEFKSASFHYVKLAGSETLCHVTRDALHTIDQSLATFCHIVWRLSQGIRDASYQDSVITSMLEHVLNGNATLIALCTVSPAKREKEVTRYTLAFVEQARRIKQSPIVNYAKNCILHRLQKHLQRLSRWKCILQLQRKHCREHYIEFEELYRTICDIQSSPVFRLLRNSNAMPTDLGRLQTQRNSASESVYTSALTSNLDTLLCKCKSALLQFDEKAKNKEWLQDLYCELQRTSRVYESSICNLRVSMEDLLYQLQLEVTNATDDVSSSDNNSEIEM